MSLADQVAEAAPDAVLDRGQQKDKPLIIADRAHLHELMENAKRVGFDHCACLTAVDWPTEELENNEEWLGREIPEEGSGLMEVVYNLYSYEHKEHLAVQVWLPRDTQDCRVASVADIWRTANWHERETYDIYGVTFEGHPNHKRIFMPEDWDGHPGRKDYDISKEQFIYREDGEDRVTTDPGKGW